jgi:hypothetical protein
MVARPRSGTTILGNALGELPGWFHVGELRYLWAEGLPKPRRDCGCRLPVAGCPTWQAVAATRGVSDAIEPAGGPEHESMAAALGLPGASSMTRTQATSMRTTRLLLGGSRALSTGPLRDYVRELDAMYDAILESTGSSVIVDTSKAPVDALLVACFSRHRPEILHVTRDPRGATLSRLKWHAEERSDGTYRLGAGRLAYEGIQWWVGELTSDLLLRRHRVRRQELRYEDFVADPGGTIRQIAASMGEPDVELPFLDRSVVTLNTNHTVSGNRNRWQVGEVPIAADEIWRDRMCRRDRALVTVATAPGLVRYGYGRRSRARSG